MKYSWGTLTDMQVLAMFRRYCEELSPTLPSAEIRVEGAEPVRLGTGSPTVTLSFRQGALASLARDPNSLLHRLQNGEVQRSGSTLGAMSLAGTVRKALAHAKEAKWVS